MIRKWNGMKITGILTVLPENEYSFEDCLLPDEKNINRVRRLKKIMGFDMRRRVKKETLESDMYISGLRYLLEKDMINIEEIGAIVVVTLTQDYLLPQISMRIHDYLNLSDDVICVDIAQGCAGYIVGLMESFFVLEHNKQKKVLLFTGDILNRKAEKDIKGSEPVFGGDAASISVIEKDESFGEIVLDIYSDGLNGKDLIMPAGAYKHPVYSEEDAWIKLEDGKCGNGLGIWMDGSEVFNFIVREVPPLIHEILHEANIEKKDIEYFFFHQPNRYILEKVADRLEIPRERMPMNIVEKYGNSNSSTVPMAITENAREVLIKKRVKCCMAGFGSGLTWGAITMEIGEMDFCEMIISEC